MTHTHKQSLTIRDLGSTHGTYIGDLKLEKDKRHPLNSGDVVTFGTKVTSGTCKSCLGAFWGLPRKPANSFFKQRILPNTSVLPIP